MTMGETFHSAFFQVLLDRLASPELLQFLCQEGLYSEIKKWEETLKMIQALLSDAEEKQLTNTAVKWWLDNLRDLAYDVEDVLDAFATEAIARKMKIQQQQASKASITTPRGDGISSGVTTETNSSPRWTTSTPALLELASQQIVEDEAQRTTDALSEEEIQLRARSGDDLGEVNEQQLIQLSVNAGSSNMSWINGSRTMNQSRSISSLSIDIKEEDNEDDELRDHSALKVTADRAFVIINFIMEVPSAVFDQLSSKQKPQYELVSLILSFVALLFCIIELFYKGGLERVAWRWNENIPWFYYPSPKLRPFGNVIDFIGLICGILQFSVATKTYALYLQHADNPIEISLWPLVFASCLLISKFLNNTRKETL